MALFLAKKLFSDDITRDDVIKSKPKVKKDLVESTYMQKLSYLPLTV